MPKILIVEDEPGMVAGLRDNFEFEGYQVLSAMDGVSGLERALVDTPDLVILDVMMPRMSGLDVCKQLKSKRPAIPIIMPRRVCTKRERSLHLRRRGGQPTELPSFPERQSVGCFVEGVRSAQVFPLSSRRGSQSGPFT